MIEFAWIALMVSRQLKRNKPKIKESALQFQ